MGCPVCHHSQSRLVFTKEYGKYMQCCGCELVYQIPGQGVPSQLDQTKDEYFSREFVSERIAQQDIHKRLARWRLSQVTKHMPDFRSVLEIGCATGEFLASAREEGARVVGVEVSPHARTECWRRGIPVYPTLEMVPPQRFDIIAMHHVLEHFDDPVGLLTRLAVVAHKQTLLYVTVPNYSSWQSLILGKNWDAILPYHFQEFTRKTLAFTLNKAGYRVVATGFRADSPLLRALAKRLMIEARLGLKASPTELPVTQVTRQSVAFKAVRTMSVPLGWLEERLGAASELFMIAAAGD